LENERGDYMTVIRCVYPGAYRIVRLDNSTFYCRCWFRCVSRVVSLADSHLCSHTLADRECNYTAIYHAFICEM